MSNFSLKAYRQLLLAIIFLSGYSIASHAATLLMVNGDTPGEGLNDQTIVTAVSGNSATTLGDQRRVAIDAALQAIGSLITDDITINVLVKFTALECDSQSALLGGAGPVNTFYDFIGSPQSGVQYPAALANLYAGIDLDPDAAEIQMEFNGDIDFNNNCLAGVNLYYGLDGAEPNGTANFYSIVLHELVHGLGFLTYMDSNGETPRDLSDPFLQLLYDVDFNAPLAEASADRRREILAYRRVGLFGDDISYRNNSLTAGAELLGLAINGEPISAPLIYNPPVYNPGSSLSHWDTTLQPQQLMGPFLSVAPITELQELDIIALAELGWPVNLPVQDRDGDGMADKDDGYPDDSTRTALPLADSDNDNLPDVWELDNGFFVGNDYFGKETFQDFDGDGLSNIEEYNLGLDPTNADSDGDNVADGVEQQLGTDPLDPASVLPYMDSLPVVSFESGQRVEEGSTFELVAYLNALPPAYPVVVSFTVAGTAQSGINVDSGADYRHVIYQKIAIYEGLEAAINIETFADSLLEGVESINFNMGGVLNAVPGPMNKHQVAIIEDNVSPLATINVMQMGNAVNIVDPLAGMVTVSATIDDININDTHVFDWSASDNSIIPVEGYQSETFSFDPLVLSDGFYRLSVAVTDDAQLPLSGSARTLIKVATAPALSATNDSDQDGLPDLTEGAIDSDNDRIPDYLDNRDQPYLLNRGIGGPDSISTEVGIVLRLGETAFAASSIDGQMGFSALEEFGSDGAAPASNTDDPDYLYTGDLYDFELSGLSQPGAVARVVIPLDFPLPVGALYRKYTESHGWDNFVTDGDNDISSAFASSNSCPLPGDSSYTRGLAAGDNCIQLTIVDGGENDADGIADGVIRDPAGIATLVVDPAIVVSTPGNSELVIPAGTNLAVAARVRLSSNANGSPLLSILLRSSGSGNEASAINAVRLVVDNNKNGAYDSGEPELASSLYTEDNGTLRLQLQQPFIINAGDTDLLVLYNF